MLPEFIYFNPLVIRQRQLNPAYLANYLDFVSNCCNKCETALENRDLREERLEDFVAKCLLPILELQMQVKSQDIKGQNIAEFCLRHYNHDKVFAQGSINKRLEALLIVLLSSEKIELMNFRSLDPTILTILQEDAASANPLQQKSNLLMIIKVLDRYPTQLKEYSIKE